MARDKSIIIEKLNLETEEWETYYKAYAEINKTSGKEYVNIKAVISKNTLNFDIIYNKKLENLIFESENYRIKWKNRFFNIINVDDYKMRHIKLLIIGESVNG